MSTRQVSRPERIVGGPVFARVVGRVLFLISLLGFVLGPLSGKVTLFFVGWVWGGCAIAYGLRLFRLGVFDSGDALVVRNRFRTKRVSWVEIVAVDFVMRSGFWGEQWCGQVAREPGTSVWLDATESLRMPIYGTELSQSQDEGRDKTARVESAWRVHTAD